ncbi:hypothetical protein DIPPA_18694 [Diplonema papillatum]|nr:hypothetical protein DIPPA_18694 [Diplonema papillatum]
MLGTDVCLSVMNEQSKSPSERYAFHEVTTGKDRQPLEDGSRLSFPPSSPSFGIPNSISNASAVDTMRIDLRKVAFRLRIPLELLLKHFQEDPSRVSTHTREDDYGEKNTLRLEMPLAKEPATFEDPIEGTPLLAADAKGGRESRRSEPNGGKASVGLSVVVAHGRESPRLSAASDSGSMTASMFSDFDQRSEVEIVGRKQDRLLPHIAYLIHDPARRVTVIAFPNLPPPVPEAASSEPSKSGPFEICRFFLCCCGFCDWTSFDYHESTSAIGELGCSDCGLICLGKTTVVKSIVLYAADGSLFLQVQRWMPVWGIPCLVTGIVCGALVPSLYRELADATDDNSGDMKVGATAALVWWALGEFAIASVLMVLALLRYGVGWLQPWWVAVWDHPLSAANVVLLVCVVSDVSRHSAWAFMIREVAQGPTMILHCAHALYLAGVQLASGKRVVLAEYGGLFAAAAGAVVSAQCLSAFDDWKPTHGITAGIVSGISTASYIVSANHVVSNNPIVGLVWICKVFSLLAALVVVGAKGDGDFWSASFFGGADGAAYALGLASAGVARDLFYLFALVALHALPLSASMLFEAVGVIILSHALLSHSLQFGDLEPKYIWPGALLAGIGAVVTCYVGLRERQFQEVDLTSPDLTRKTAKAPPKLTMAALRHQQRMAKGSPPALWEFYPPPTGERSPVGRSVGSPVRDGPPE